MQLLSVEIWRASVRRLRCATVCDVLFTKAHACLLGNCGCGRLLDSVESAGSIKNHLSEPRLGEVVELSSIVSVDEASLRDSYQLLPNATLSFRTAIQYRTR